MNRLRKMKGFTLIELIVVVVIIAVLAALAAIGYQKFVNGAREGAVEADAVQVAKVINADLAETGQVPDGGYTVEYIQGLDSNLLSGYDSDDITINTAGEFQEFQLTDGDVEHCVILPKLSTDTARAVDCTPTTTP